MESGESDSKAEAYRSVDIFTRLLWYHDKNKHVLYDNAHQFANVLKQMMNLIKNRTKKDKLHFNENIRKFELAQGTHTHKHTHIRLSVIVRTTYVVRSSVIVPYNVRRTF